MIEPPSAAAIEYAQQLPPIESKEPVEEEVLTHSPTHSPTHSLTYSLTHLLTHSLTQNDEDVLSLPSITALAKSLDLWLPQQLQPNTELTLKRGVISCLDLLGVGAPNSAPPTRLDVDNIVAQAGDYSLTHSLIHSLSLTHSLTHSLTYSLTHLLTYLLTHLLTYSLTH